MFKKAVTVAAIVACVGAAAANVKFHSFVLPTAADDPDAAAAALADNPNVDGMASYKFNRGTGNGTVQVILHDLQPCTDYCVQFGDNNFVYAPHLSFQTNAAGNAEWHHDFVPFAPITECEFQLSVYKYDGVSYAGDDPRLLRAIASPD